MRQNPSLTRPGCPRTWDKPNAALLLRKAAIKWLLVTFCSTHGSVSQSAILREASSCRRLEQRWRTATGQCTKSERPPNSWSKWDISVQSLPSRPRIRQKDCRSQLGWKTPRKQGLLGTAGLMLLWTHRDWGSMLGTWADLSQIGSQCWERE